MKKLLLVLTVCCISTSLYCQNDSVNYPVIGKRCPDFILKDVQYYPQRQVSLNDLKGKYVILDFWSKNCSGCIESFPTINQLQNQFKGKCQILLVGYDDSEKVARKIYDKFRSKYNLNIPCAFDTALWNRFRVYAAGICIWLDNKGIVQAISGNDDITSPNLLSFINDKHFKFTDFSEQTRQMQNQTYSRYTGLFEDSLSKNILIRSSLSIYNPQIQPIKLEGTISRFIKLVHEHKLPPYFEIMGQNINSLFMYAYMGSTYFTGNTVWNKPLYRVKDSNSLRKNKNELYNYSLKIPLSRFSDDFLMKRMQQDLFDYFGYKGNLKQIEMPCLKLVIADTNAVKRIITNSKEKYKIQIVYDHKALGFYIKNDFMESVCLSIGHYLAPQLPIENCTGIQNNINLRLNATMSDINELRAGLRKSGLDLVHGKKKLRVLTISD